MSSNEPLKKRSFSLNVLTLAGGTGLAQVIGFMLMPLLTRLYSPSDFGYFTQYTSFYNLLVPLASFQYSLAIMLPKEDQEAIEVLRLSIWVSLFFGAALFATAIISGFSFIQFPKNLNNHWLLTLFSLTLIIGGGILAYTQWSMRMKRFFLMSLSKMTQVSGMVIIQSLAGFIWGSTLFGLVFGHMMGYLIGLGVLVKGNETLKTKPLLLTPIPPLITSMIRYKKFPLFTSWGSILDGVSFFAVPLLLAMYFQPDMIGKYALANTALSAPIMLIGHSISQVFYQRLSENIKKDLGINDMLYTVLARLFLIAILIGSVIYIFGPIIFGLLFGSKWASAGHFAQILVPVMISQLILSPLSGVLIVKEKQGILLIAQIIRSFITVTSIVVPGMAGFNELELLLVFSISRAIANLIHLFIICKVARV